MNILSKTVLLVSIIFSLSASASEIMQPGVIESFDLEAQTITIQGKNYQMSPKTRVLDFEKNNVGYGAIQNGLTIQFSFTESNRSTQPVIIDLVIMSDEVLKDRRH